MNRYKQREQAFLIVFESLFTDDSPENIISVFEENIGILGDYARKLYLGVCNNQDKIDEIISNYSTGWKLSRISKVNISILRIAVYEMKFESETPDSVAINEAVELAKRFSGKEDAAFVNGVLGSYSRSGE